MEFWEQLTKAALLGTQKHSGETIQLPDSIASLLHTPANEDKEDTFLKTVALAMNYMSAGREFPLLQTSQLQVSEPESLPLCSREATELLRRIVYEKQDELLDALLNQMLAHKCRVAEELIPDLLDKGKENKQMRDLIRQVTGKRGEWLSAINPEWQYFTSVPVEEVWQTGKLEERKEVLEKVRREDPAKSREWLQEVWKTENAHTKAALLSVFSLNSSLEDEPMLEEILSDKSHKVRETASSLLQALSGSALIERVWAKGKSWLVLKKSGSLLSKKTRLELTIPKPLSEEFIKDGIEPGKEKYLKEVASRNPIQKWAVSGCSETEVWLYQLFAVIPPARWSKHLELKQEVFVGFFLNNDLSKFIPALIQATLLHQDIAFAHTLLKHYSDISKLFKPSKNDADIHGLKYALISILPEKQSYQDELLQLLNNDNYLFYSHIQVFDYEWPLPFALKVLKKISEKCSSSQYYYYYYDAKQVQKLSAYLPVGVLHEWMNLQPADEMGKARWQQATALLCNSLELKKRVKEVFA
jgi:hypothetical protein